MVRDSEISLACTHGLQGQDDSHARWYVTSTMNNPLKARSDRLILLTKLRAGLMVFATLLLFVALAPAKADVDPTSGHYSETVEDLQVKVLGGYVTSDRTWYQGAWRFNRRWSPLEFVHERFSVPDDIFIDIAFTVEEIRRNGVTYKKEGDSYFTFGRRLSIERTTDGYRWSDRDGNWIDYSLIGLPVRYGDRNNVQVSLQHDANNRLVGVLDHHGNQVLWFEYEGNNGNPSAVYDASGRRVQYRYNDQSALDSVIDVRGKEWQYTYSGSGAFVTPKVATLTIIRPEWWYALYRVLASKTDPRGETTRFSYDAIQRLTKVEDSLGVRGEFSYSYDKATKEYYFRESTPGGRIQEDWFGADGTLLRRVINGQTVESLERDETASGRIFSRSDRNGNTVKSTLDEWDNLIRIEHADGAASSYTYEPGLSSLTQQVDENGIVTRYEYDAQGNLTARREAFGTDAERRMEYGYDAFGNPTGMHVPADARTQEANWSVTYDGYGNPTEITDPEGHTRRYTSDIMGNVLTYTDPLGKVWRSTYDPAGNLRTHTDPLDRSVEITYDAAGNLTGFKDAAGHQTTYAYDARNRLVGITDAAGGTQRYTYTPENILTSVTDPSGYTERSAWTPDLRPASLTDAAGNITRVHHADDGDPASGAFSQANHVEYPTFAKRFAFDRRNRVMGETLELPDGRRLLSVNQYDPAGALIAETDPESNTYRYHYDPFYNLDRVNDPLGFSTLGSYDARDNLVAVTDARGETFGLGYDRNGRLVTETWPLGETWTYGYDAADRLTTVDDPMGQRVGYGYDDAGQLQEVRYYPAVASDSPDATTGFSYDERGNLTGWNDGTHSATYVYDALNRMTSVSVDYGAFTAGYSYEYQANGLKKAFIAPDGTRYEYLYDSGGRLEGVDIPGAGRISRANFNWFAPTLTLFPGGASQSTTHDGLLNPTELISRTADDAVLKQDTLTYNGNQQLTSRTDPSGATAYEYDAASRLTKVVEPDGSEQGLALDPVGNLLKKGETVEAWTYNADDQLLAADGATFEYDPDGNLVKKTVGGVEQRYVYDIADRLVRVEDDGGVIARYGYDPFGRRLWKEVGGQKTYYLYAEEGLVAELDGGGNAQVEYGYYPDSIWGTHPLFLKEGGQHYFYHNDQLSTPRLLTTIAGDVVWSATYDAFGMATVDPSSTVTNNLRLPGQYYDAETGLHYNRFRYYDPDTGRYTRADPLVGLTGGINPYRYADNDPINLIDPYGLKTGVLGELGPLAACIIAGDICDPLLCLDSLYKFFRCGGPLSSVFWDCGSAVLPFVSAAGVKALRGLLKGETRLLLTKGDDAAKFVRKSAIEKSVSREQRWVDLANQPNSRLPKEVIDHVNRHDGKGVADRFGLELAHKPKRAASQGYDYSEAIPKTVADHRGIQHRYLKERSTGTTISMPKKKIGTGKLSLPPKDALP